MKANKAPKKIYISTINVGDNHYSISKTTNPVDKKYEVEYTRTDAFIEKACEYIKEHLFDYWSQSVTNESKFIENFKKYMKGE